MGKKSRRPNRNRPKDIPAVASPPGAAPRQVITSPATDLLTFHQLCDSEDWEGVLELESEMSDIANRLDNSDSSLGGMINFMLGRAHKALGREGGIEEATLYYQKAIELAKRRVTMIYLFYLFECYVKNDRIEEAMDLYKSLCEEVGKESLDPNIILGFSQIRVNKHEYSRLLTILEEHLEAIEISWGKREQCKAYEVIARLYCF